MTRSGGIPLTDAAKAVLAALPRQYGYVWTNSRTKDRYTVNGTAQVFRRAVERAGITTGDVTLHTLRHTGISRMVASGIDDFTVISISGHSSTRMLERYSHPTEARKLDALASFNLSSDVTNKAQRAEADPDALKELQELLGKSGGRREDRTRDLRVANAALSQLS